MPVQVQPQLRSRSWAGRFSSSTAVMAAFRWPCWTISVMTRRSARDAMPRLLTAGVRRGKVGAMTTAQATDLLGSYSAPAFRYGEEVEDERRGTVRVVGLSSAPIPWPGGQQGRRKTLILYGALADAVRRESAAAVAHHWGVGHDTVWKWRKALGVGQMTEGTRRLKSATLSPHLDAIRPLSIQKADDPA